MTKSTFTKTKAQMKSSSYYTFWSIAPVAVVAGQIYVGTGYRAMSKSLDAWFDKTISIMIQKRMLRQQGRPEGYYMPKPSPERYNDDGVVYLKDLDPDDYILWKEIDADK